METKTIEGIVKALKEIIDQKGPKYLTDEPYQVYVELISSGVADRKTAAALLHLLASGLLETADPGYDANGFEFVSCEGDGNDDGYEPKFRKGWY